MKFNLKSTPLFFASLTTIGAMALFITGCAHGPGKYCKRILKPVCDACTPQYVRDCQDNHASFENSAAVAPKTHSSGPRVAEANPFEEFEPRRNGPNCRNAENDQRVYDNVVTKLFRKRSQDGSIAGDPFMDREEGLNQGDSEPALKQSSGVDERRNTIPQTPSRESLETSGNVPMQDSPFAPTDKQSRTAIERLKEEIQRNGEGGRGVTFQPKLRRPDTDENPFVFPETPSSGIKALELPVDDGFTDIPVEPKPGQSDEELKKPPALEIPDESVNSVDESPFNPEASDNAFQAPELPTDSSTVPENPGFDRGTPGIPPALEDFETSLPTVPVQPAEISAPAQPESGIGANTPSMIVDTEDVPPRAFSNRGLQVPVDAEETDLTIPAPTLSEQPNASVEELVIDAPDQSSNLPALIFPNDENDEEVTIAPPPPADEELDDVELLAFANSINPNGIEEEVTLEDVQFDSPAMLAREADSSGFQPPIVLLSVIVLAVVLLAIILRRRKQESA